MILDKYFRRKNSILKYYINYTTNHVNVWLDLYEDKVGAEEYIKLLLYYYCKVIDILQESGKGSDKRLDDILRKILREKFSCGTNVFQILKKKDIGMYWAVVQRISGVYYILRQKSENDIISYSEIIQGKQDGVRLTGEFCYGENSKFNFIYTKFDVRNDFEELLLSIIALLQYVLNRCKDDNYNLSLLWYSIGGTIEFYEANTRVDLEYLIDLPEKAYKLSFDCIKAEKAVGLLAGKILEKTVLATERIIYYYNIKDNISEIDYLGAFVVFEEIMKRTAIELFINQNGEQPYLVQVFSGSLSKETRLKYTEDNGINNNEINNKTYLMEQLLNEYGSLSNIEGSVFQNPMIEAVDQLIGGIINYVSTESSRLLISYILDYIINMTEDYNYAISNSCVITGSSSYQYKTISEIKDRLNTNKALEWFKEEEKFNMLTEELKQEHIKYAKVYFDRGLMHISKKEYASAYVDLSSAIAIYPGLWDCYFYRGKCKMILGESDSAYEDFNKASKLNRNNMDV